MCKGTNQTKHKRRAIAKVGYFFNRAFYKKWKMVKESKSLEKAPRGIEELKCSATFHTFSGIFLDILTK